MIDYPSCYQMDQPKAKKVHKCCECHGEIPIGEIYNLHHGIWNHEPASYKVCRDCDALRDECDKDAMADEITPFGGLSDTVIELSDHDIVLRFIEIKKKRNAVIPDWLSRIIEED